MYSGNGDSCGFKSALSSVSTISFISVSFVTVACRLTLGVITGILLEGLTKLLLLTGLVDEGPTEDDLAGSLVCDLLQAKDSLLRLEFVLTSVLVDCGPSVELLLYIVKFELLLVCILTEPLFSVILAGQVSGSD